MLTTNWDVESRFANGTQGRIGFFLHIAMARRPNETQRDSPKANSRLLCWHPCGEEQQKRRKILQASHPDLSCRFVKESSLNKAELMADIDHVESGLDTALRPSVSSASRQM